MKRLAVLIVLVLAAASIAFAQAAKKGPIVDRVYYDVKMNEEICLKDVSEGRADIFLYDEQGNVVKALPADVRAKMDAYIVPAGIVNGLDSYLRQVPVGNRQPPAVLAGSIGPDS